MADASVSLDLDAKQLYQELQNVTAQFVRFTQKTDEASNKVGGGSGFGGNFAKNLQDAAASLGAGAAIHHVVEYGQHIADLSQRFGVSTTALQQFGNAAEKNGSSLEGVAKGFRFLEVARSKALGGNDAMLKSFEALGVSAEQLRTAAPEDIMLQIGRGSLNAADVVKVLGKSALELRPTLAGLADGTIEFGHALSEIDIERLDAADDAIKTLKENMTILGGSVISGFVSAWQQGINSILSLFNALGVAQGGVIDAAVRLTHGDFAGAKNAFTGGLSDAKEQIRLAVEANEEIAKGKDVHRDKRFGTGDNADTEGGATDDTGRALKGNKDERELEQRQRETARDAEKLAEVERQRHRDSLSFAAAQADRQRQANDLLAQSNAQGPGLEDERLKSKLAYYDVVKEIETEEQKHAREMKQAEEDRTREIAKSGRELGKGLKNELSDRGKLSLKDIADSGVLIGGPAGDARRALREEELSRRRALAGDLTGALEHQNRADAIKNSIGVLKDSEKNKEFLNALNQAEVLQKIEKNTAGAGANK